MDKVPGKNPPGTSQVHSEFSQPVSLQCSWVRKWSVHSQCSRSCDQGVPIRNTMGTFKIFPKKVPRIFLSGTFRMSLKFHPWCTTFGKFWVNSGNTARTSPGNWKTGDILNVPSISPKFTQNLLKVVYHGWNFKDILNVPLRKILGTFFGKILNVPMVFLMGTPWSHDLEHCECTDHFLTQEHCRETGWENSEWT